MEQNATEPSLHWKVTPFSAPIFFHGRTFPRVDASSLRRLATAYATLILYIMYTQYLLLSKLLIKSSVIYVMSPLILNPTKCRVRFAGEFSTFFISFFFQVSVTCPHTDCILAERNAVHCLDSV